MCCACLCVSKKAEENLNLPQTFVGCSSFGNIGLMTWRLCCFDVKLEVDALASKPLHQFLPHNFLVSKQRPRCPLTHGLWSFYLDPDICRWQTAIPVKVHPKKIFQVKENVVVGWHHLSWSVRIRWSISGYVSTKVSFLVALAYNKIGH